MWTGVEMNVTGSTQSLDKHDATADAILRPAIRSIFADIDLHVFGTDTESHRPGRHG